VATEGFSELVAPGGRGRVFSQEVSPGFADSAPSGRVRLDAIARWLQDVAYADVADAGLEQAAVWVVRRTRIAVGDFPRFGERFGLATFCSGLGRMWAERRTTVTRLRDSRACVEAVSLWIHLDPASWRPTPFSAAELAAYGDAARGRRVPARLRHPAPSLADGSASWAFRATECDLAGHVNNAAYWQPLEEELLSGSDPERIDAEIEYRTPAQPGPVRVARDGARRWIVDGDGETLASIVVAGGQGPDPSDPSGSANLELAP
jgi:acyl-ACP thioesterase